jgi:nicotinate-nucleotide pyrophosphorylase (carboxylating)
MFDVSHPEIRDSVRRALAEDIGSGDITSELTVPAGLTARGIFLAKQELVLAGVELLPLIYEMGADKGKPESQVELLHASGTHLEGGAEIARAFGPARTLLRCERVALNFLQRLSGIATLGARYVDAVSGTKTRVLDTRKTTPGLRQLEKMAAAAAGVTNHRRGLFDAVLIKNNHITAARGVAKALAATKNYEGPVEIEVRTRAELDEALDAGAKHLLLDNLTPEEATEWIRCVGGRAQVELSGNISLKTIRKYAEARPDFISCGAITHSATAVDISFGLHLDLH